MKVRTLKIGQFLQVFYHLNAIVWQVKLLEFGQVVQILHFGDFVVLQVKHLQVGHSIQMLDFGQFVVIQVQNCQIGNSRQVANLVDFLILMMQMSDSCIKVFLSLARKLYKFSANSVRNLVGIEYDHGWHVVDDTQKVSVSRLELRVLSFRFPTTNYRTQSRYICCRPESSIQQKLFTKVRLLSWSLSPAW